MRLLFRFAHPAGKLVVRLGSARVGGFQFDFEMRVVRAHAYRTVEALRFTSDWAFPHYVAVDPNL
jgi:hypothetical protein